MSDISAGLYGQVGHYTVMSDSGGAWYCHVRHSILVNVDPNSIAVLQPKMWGFGQAESLIF